MQDPIAQQAGTHGSGGAIEHAKQRVLAARARVDEVEIALRGGIDEHMRGVFAHAWVAQMIAGSA